MREFLIKPCLHSCIHKSSPFIPFFMHLHEPKNATNAFYTLSIHSTHRFPLSLAPLVSDLVSLPISLSFFPLIIPLEYLLCLIRQFSYSTNSLHVLIALLSFPQCFSSDCIILYNIQFLLCCSHIPCLKFTTMQLITLLSHTVLI